MTATKPASQSVSGGHAVDRTDETALLNVDLLDRVIDRIFTAGTLLESATDEATPRGATTIQRAVAELDEALREIRRGVFEASAQTDRLTDLNR